MSERRALGEKPVAGMDRLGAGRLAGVNDLVDHEIGLSRGGRPDSDRLIGHFDMERILIGFRIDGDRLDSHASRGLDDPARDLATVGDEDLLEHRRPNREKRRAFRSGHFYGKDGARKQPCRDTATAALARLRGQMSRPVSLRNARALRVRGLAGHSGPRLKSRLRPTAKRLLASVACARRSNHKMAPDRPSEWRSGPRISAEARVAGADNPGDWVGRVSDRLSAHRTRLKESAESKNGYERGCSFRHAETLLDRAAHNACLASDAHRYWIMRLAGRGKEIRRLSGSL